MVTAEQIREYEAVLTADPLEAHPVTERFRFVSFVSKSKGKGRKRSAHTTIELIEDKWESSRLHHRRFISFHKAPFDKWANETYSLDQSEYDQSDYMRDWSTCTLTKRLYEEIRVHGDY